MTEPIYDDPDFFAAYGQMPRSVHGLAGAPEWPTIRALLPDLSGKRVVDLGCGYGWFARWAIAHGATHVTAIDVSQRMLARAAELTDDPRIAYTARDLERLDLLPESFDLAYSSLALHYVSNLSGVLSVVHRALAAGSRFVFTVEHPIYTAPRSPEWQRDRSGHKFWPLDRYAVEGVRTTNWLGGNIVKYHRTLGTIVNQLIGAGFTIEHVRDWSPTPAEVAADPALSDELERPTFLLVSARR
jgi:SAM-dependent methyltransferase